MEHNLLVILFVINICAINSSAINDNQTYPDFLNCICVPYWQCKEDYSGLTDDISSIVDIRILRNSERTKPTCSGDFDVCCQIECGRRRRSGITEFELGDEDNTNPENRLRRSLLFGNRILGEKNEAAFGEFPWMLGILWNKAFQCGASLIHPQVALTAAHCVHGRTGPFKIRAGEYNWESNKEILPHQDRFSQKIIIHQHYNPGSLRNDIALIVLNEPFLLSENVGVVCIPPQNIIYDGATCTTSGWGKNGYSKGGSFQSTLKKTDLPIVPRDECTRSLQQVRLGPFFRLHRSFICAGGEANKDTCKGDGGSPLVCPVDEDEERYEQTGIVSWGLTCGMRNTPGVYVNVALFSDWIDGNMIKMNFDTNIYKY